MLASTNPRKWLELPRTLSSAWSGSFGGAVKRDQPTGDDPLALAPGCHVGEAAVPVGPDITFGGDGVVQGQGVEDLGICFCGVRLEVFEVELEFR